MACCNACEGKGTDMKTDVDRQANAFRTAIGGKVGSGGYTYGQNAGTIPGRGNQSLPGGKPTAGKPPSPPKPKPPARPNYAVTADALPGTQATNPNSDTPTVTKDLGVGGGNARPWWHYAIVAVAVGGIIYAAVR